MESRSLAGTSTDLDNFLISLGCSLFTSPLLVSMCAQCLGEDYGVFSGLVIKREALLASIGILREESIGMAPGAGICKEVIKSHIAFADYDGMETSNEELRGSPCRKATMSSNDVDELLECPVCMNLMYPPIYQAFSGLDQALSREARLTGNTTLNAFLNTQYLVQIGIFTAVPMVMGFILELGLLKVSQSKSEQCHVLIISLFFVFVCFTIKPDNFLGLVQELPPLYCNTGVYLVYQVMCVKGYFVSYII